MRGSQRLPAKKEAQMTTRFLTRLGAPLVLALITAAPAMARDRYDSHRGGDRRGDRYSYNNGGGHRHHDSLGRVIVDVLRDAARESRSSRYYRRDWRGYDHSRYEGRRSDRCRTGGYPGSRFGYSDESDSYDDSNGW